MTRRVLVTGGPSSGIGKETARAFVATGAAFRVAIALTIASLLAACTGPQRSPNIASDSAPVEQIRRPNTTEPQWAVRLGPSEVNAALVFVHGIFGDTLGTWSDEQSGRRFFDMIASDPSFTRRIDIFMFGYPSNMVEHDSFSIQEAATRLYSQLKFNRVFEYPELAFAAHSMGGLVVMEMLLNHREIASKVRVLVLFATPQEGAQITRIARFLVRNPALEDMFPADRNSFLQQLNDQWRLMGPDRPHVACAYEKLKTEGVLIVPWASATRFCDGAATPVDANHLTIVKPTGPSSDSYQTLANALTSNVVSITGRDCVNSLTADSTITVDSTVQRATIRCGVSEPEAKGIALENLRIASRKLGSLQDVKRVFFFRALQTYESARTQANWRVVVDQERTVRQLIQDAVISVVKIEPEIARVLGPNLDRVSTNLLTRSATLSSLEDFQKLPTLAEAQNIEVTQEQLYRELQEELDNLIRFASAGSVQ